MRNLFLFILLSIAVYGVDISTKTNQEQQLKKDQSISIKKNQTNTNEKKKTNTKSNTLSSSYEINFKPTAIYLQLADECIKEIKAPSDFGLSSDIDGGFDLIQQELLELSAKANRPIKEVGANEEKLKKYISCIIDNSGRIIQSNLFFQTQNILSTKDLEKFAVNNFQKAKKITDESVLNKIQEAKDSLNSNCRFLNSIDKIQCKNLVFDLTNNELKFSNLTIYDSSNLENFFGISTNLKLSIARNTSSEQSNLFITNNSSNREVGIQKNKSITNNLSSEQNLNTNGFIPKGN